MATTGNCARCGRHANLDRKSRCATCRKELQKAFAAKARTVVLGILGLALLNVAMWVLGQPKALSGEAGMEQRLATVRAIASETYAKEGHPPKSLADMADAIATAGFNVPILLPKAARPVPNAVIVDPQGDRLRLGVTTESGQIHKKNNVPTEVQVP